METIVSVPTVVDTRSTLARGVDQAASSAHDTINSVSEATPPMVERMASNAHVVVDRVAGAATQATETLGKTGEQIKSAQDRLTVDARGYVRRHPIAVIGVAFAAGYVLSRLTASR